MVVIIDDRADVWDGSPNLVKVIPCASGVRNYVWHCAREPLTRSSPATAPPDDFFVGIGDINAAFLPKKKELAGSKVTAAAAPTDPAIPPSAASSSPEASTSYSSPSTTTPPSTPPPVPVDIRVSDGPSPSFRPSVYVLTRSPLAQTQASYRTSCPIQ